jgi:hypothetical protein
MRSLRKSSSQERYEESLGDKNTNGHDREA